MNISSSILETIWNSIGLPLLLVFSFIFVLKYAVLDKITSLLEDIDSELRQINTRLKSMEIDLENIKKEVRRID
jgi:hypothetical protein